MVLNSASEINDVAGNQTRACSDILSAIFEAFPTFLCSAISLKMTSQVPCNFLVTLFRTGPLNSYQTFNQLVQIYFKKLGTYYRNTIDLVFPNGYFSNRGYDLFQNSLILNKTLLSEFTEQIRQCTLSSYLVLKLGFKFRRNKSHGIENCIIVSGEKRS